MKTKISSLPAAWLPLAPLLIATLVLLLGCDRDQPSGPGRAASASARDSRSVSSSIAPPPHDGPTDVTFLVTADTHFGASVELPGRICLNPHREPKTMALARVHEVIVKDMNALPGRAYPGAIGGAVGEPRGLLIAGDLTESGEPEQWRQFLRLYGRRGVGAGLPVFEVPGNHDGNGPVKQAVCRRHGGCNYAFSWDGLRLIALSDGPDDEGLRFLRDELKGLGRGRPVVLYFHFPLAGPYSRRNWFGDGDYRHELAEVIHGYRVIAIFHGHYHGSGHYLWRFIDVYNVGSVKHDQRSFAVVHVTDDCLTVASYNYEGGFWWWWHRTPLGPPSGTSACRELWRVDRSRDRRFWPDDPYPL